MEEYETIFLSCLLNKPEYKNDVPDFRPEYFENEIFREVYKAITPEKKFPEICRDLDGKVPFKDLIEWKSAKDIVTVTDTQFYGEMVLEGYKRREVSKLDGKFFSEIYQKVNMLNSITLIPEKEENISEAFLRLLDEVYRSGCSNDTYKTGFDAVDRIIHGFNASELIIIGGRPAMGKSTIGLNIAYNMAKDKKKIAYFSLEMSKLDLYKRLVKVVAGIENMYKLTQEQFDRCVEVSKAIDERLPLTIYDKPDITVEGIRAKCARLKEDEQIDVVVIDHINILKSSKIFRSSYEEMSDVSRQLKVLAKELGKPVIALCQLNRGLENREVKLPTMADIRDSGKIEENADMICFVHRDEYYLTQKNEDVPPEKKGVANFLIAKNRRGGVGMVELRFNPKIPTFY